MLSLSLLSAVSKARGQKAETGRLRTTNCFYLYIVILHWSKTLLDAHAHMTAVVIISATYGCYQLIEQFGVSLQRSTSLRAWEDTRFLDVTWRSPRDRIWWQKQIWQTVCNTNNIHIIVFRGHFSFLSIYYLFFSLQVLYVNANIFL